MWKFAVCVLAFVLQVSAAADSQESDDCMEVTDHLDESFMQKICKSRPDLKNLTIFADNVFKEIPELRDLCGRVVDKPENDSVELVDFIVVGGGAAGPVMAGRLSENPDWTVTLLESGPEQPEATDIPAFVSLAVGSEYDWNYTTIPQKNACLAFNGVCDWPRGKLLGGTAALSGSMYSRAHRDIYDSWLNDGNIGWGYDDVLPFFKMSENNKDYTTDDDLRIHGTSGPIPVQKPTDILPITRTLVEAGSELGYNVIDMSDPKPMGFSIAQAMINVTNVRVTMPRAFLRPYVRSRNNLYVKLNSHVTKLLVDRKRKLVYGVEYVDKMKNKRKLFARKEVILSAGVIGSPQILMLSGIGPEEDLVPLGIPVIENLRVGHNLQHHVASELKFSLNMTNDKTLSKIAILDYSNFTKGALSTTGALQTSAFLRSNQVGPNEPADVQLFFDGFLPTCENYQTDSETKETNRKTMMTIRPVNIRPKSRGTIKLVSSDPFVYPEINPNYLSEESDADVLVWGLKLAHSMLNTTALRKWNATLYPLPVRACKTHALASDAYWRCYVKHHTDGDNHHAGTCKMGPSSDPSAVVDSELRVHNVRGVRVVDASIFPLNPNCNPIASLVMVAEKAVQFINDTWNVKK